MYEELNCFEEALKHFGTRVEVICALELSNRISSEDAYRMIKEEMKEVKNVVNGLIKMNADDGLKVHQNDDGTFSLEWDNNDSRWNWMNNLTSKEIQSIMEKAIREKLDEEENL